MSSIRARTYHIVQYEYHPYDAYDSDGNLKPDAVPLITQDNIDNGLCYKSIKRWAYIWHDRDVYTEKEEINDATGRIKAGDKKPKHVHIVINGDNAIELQAVARWFGVPEQYVDVPKGAGAFLDSVEYLSHSHPNQQALGKHLYPDEEVISNFEWRKEIEDRREKQLRYGANLNAVKQMQQDVLVYGRTLKSCREDDPILFAQNINILPRLRSEYLASQKAPETRMNYYVSGDGGIGKSILCAAFARALYPDLSEDEAYYEVQGNNVEFQSYDGQPIIIWDDFRPDELLSACGNRGMLYNIFDTFPRGTSTVNKKYGYVPLNHRVNIVNGALPYDKFLDNLAYNHAYGLEEDASQTYRRFPVILEVTENMIEMLINKGYIQNTREYKQYEYYGAIRNNIRKIKAVRDTELKQVAQERFLAPIMEMNEAVENAMANHSEDIDIDSLDYSLRPSYEIICKYKPDMLPELEAKYKEFLKVWKTYYGNSEYKGGIKTWVRNGCPSACIITIGAKKDMAFIKDVESFILNETEHENKKLMSAFFENKLDDID